MERLKELIEDAKEEANKLKDNKSIESYADGKVDAYNYVLALIRYLEKEK